MYRHLHAKNIESINGFKVPSFLGFNDEYLIVEMTLVKPPFVVDFASARLSRPELFSVEIMEEWEREKKEEFENDWPRVKGLISSFRAIGVYLTDVHPRNVACR